MRSDSVLSELQYLFVSELLFLAPPLLVYLVNSSDRCVFPPQSDFWKKALTADQL